MSLKIYENSIIKITSTNKFCTYIYIFTYNNN